MQPVHWSPSVKEHTVTIRSLALAYLSAALISSLLLSPSSVCLAGYWSSVGGNNEHNGLSDEIGSYTHEVRWEVATLPATIAMQVFTWDTFAVTMRYNFSPMQGPLVCHNAWTGDTVWTRLYRPAGKFLPFAMGDGRVYVRNFKETGHDTIFCIDAATGDILWQSDWTGPLGIIWCGCLAEDGDLITPCAENGIARLDKETGDTVWTNSRPIPNTGAEWIAMSGSTVYAWEALGINRPKYLIAIDAAGGHTLFKTPELPGDGDQEIPFIAGPGNRVYCQRDGGLFYAFLNIDTAFAQLWTRSDLSLGTYSNCGVGPDSTLYVPSGTRIYRLNPETGATVDSSPVLASAAINARISIDKWGYVYATVTTGTGEGHVYALTAGLTELWHDDIGYCYYSGPALTHPNLMIVSGPGTLLRAYMEGMPAVAEQRMLDEPRMTLEARPNPTRGRTTIRLSPSAQRQSPLTLRIYDASGCLVHSEFGPRASSFPLDLCSLSSGTYFLRLDAGSDHATTRLVVQR
jgi:outer membrane protein assembly factor BamB